MTLHINVSHIMRMSAFASLIAFMFVPIVVSLFDPQGALTTMRQSITWGFLGVAALALASDDFKQLKRVAPVLLFVVAAHILLAIGLTNVLSGAGVATRDIQAATLYTGVGMMLYASARSLELCFGITLKHY